MPQESQRDKREQLMDKLPDVEKEPWIQHLEKSDMLALLQIYWSELSQRRSIQQNYATIYVTLLSTIVGASVAGASLVTTFPQNLFITIGPILSFFIAHYAKDTILRQDSHVREVIALIAKIENYLGLYGKIAVRGDGEKAELWPGDKSFIIPRWVDARTQSGQFSEDFIRKKPGGTARNLYRTFLIIQILSLILLIYIILVPLIP